MTDTVAQAQDAGYTANMSGIPPTGNPYPWSTAQGLCKAWNAGYAAARTDRVIANRAVTP
jgi:ribosome modulation factor